MANKKLLLLQDVKGLGRSGKLVSVKPGFARNFLLPQGQAFIADKRTLRIQERLQARRAQQAAEDKKDAEAQANQLADLAIETRVKVDQHGHLFGSVSVNDIIELVSQQAKIEVDRKAILLKHPIKKLGVHQISLRLKEGVKAVVTIRVMTEDGSITVEQPAKRDEEHRQAEPEESTDEGSASEPED